jgi:dTDP-4-dehydrorhamnose 3,5-epimerase
MICIRKPMSHDLGSFVRIFCSEEFLELGIQKPVVQVNHSYTRNKWSVRGLHYQRFPHAEIKLVTCLRGEAFDVAVDLRRDSPTFLNWHGEILSAKNDKSLYVPEGFAHGYQTLTDDCEMLYLHTAPYMLQFEGAVHAMDPALRIQWPSQTMELSDRDKKHPFIGQDFDGIPI